MERDKVEEITNSTDSNSSAAVIANLTHELKTPLHSILAVASLLQGEADGPLTKEQAKQVDIIVRNGEALLGLITDLLDYSTLVSGRPPKVEWVGLKHFLKEQVASLEILASKNNTKLQAELEGVPESFATDVFYLKQIVNNLLSNAIKFSAGADITFAVDELKDKSVRFQVMDSGIGMSPDVRQAIFEEFYQADNSDSKNYEGVGLGLSLVKTSVDKLNGKIDVQSEKGQGTLFTVIIPSLKERIPVYKILVIEADNGVRLSLDKLLTGEGYKVYTNKSYENTIESLAETCPDLVLLDLSSNPKVVLQIVKRIRANSWGESLPIILMSSFDNATDRASGFLSGASDFIAKPFDVREVVARVKMHIRVPSQK